MRRCTLPPTLRRNSHTGIVLLTPRPIPAALIRTTSCPLLHISAHAVRCMHAQLGTLPITAGQLSPSTVGTMHDSIPETHTVM
jgi:hypothetical protein